MIQKKFKSQSTLRRSEDEPRNDYQLVRDKERRVIKPPIRFGVVDLSEFALAVAQDVEDSKPASYKEAINSLEKDKWLAAMAEEYEALQRNKA